jgi:hypothetical protein
MLFSSPLDSVSLPAAGRGEAEEKNYFFFREYLCALISLTGT